MKLTSAAEQLLPGVGVSRLPMAVPNNDNRLPAPAEDGEESDALSSLVASIYDATLDPKLWMAVLRECGAFVEGHSASIFSKDVAGINARLYHHDGTLDQHYARLYFEQYARLDPANEGHLFAELEQAISTLDLFEHEEFHETRFYKEWVAPQGLVDFISAPIEKQGGWAAMFGVFRTSEQGMVDDRMRRRVKLLVPHIRRAVLIGKVIERGNQEVASFGDTLDGLASGMFLVDARGRVVHANAAGTAMLADGDVVRQRDGRVVPVDRAAGAALAEVFSAADEGDGAVGSRGISVAMQGDEGENYVAHVLPLTSGQRRSTGMNYSAVAALFIHRATLDTPAAPEVIAKTFGLTLSELRVLVAIVQVGGVPETAEALGIGEATVKTHLHRVFSKTGTARQAELVKLVAGFASPLSR